MCYSADSPADLHRRMNSDAGLRSLALKHHPAPSPTSDADVEKSSKDG